MIGGKSLKTKCFVLIVLVGLISCRLAWGQVVASFFYNQDGTIREQRDTNGDGKADRWIYYNKEGKIERAEQDENFDGKADVFLFYSLPRRERLG